MDSSNILNIILTHIFYNSECKTNKKVYSRLSGSYSKKTSHLTHQQEQHKCNSF